jgi:hypothetical protein
MPPAYVERQKIDAADAEAPDECANDFRNAGCLILSGKCLAARPKKSILPAGRMTDDG